MHQVELYNPSWNSRGNQVTFIDFKFQNLPYQIEHLLFQIEHYFQTPYIYFIFCPFWANFMVMGAPIEGPQYIF
jgi:hypothetical protein